MPSNQPQDGRAYLRRPSQHCTDNNTASRTIVRLGQALSLCCVMAVISGFDLAVIALGAVLFVMIVKEMHREQALDPMALVLAGSGLILTTGIALSNHPLFYIGAVAYICTIVAGLRKELGLSRWRRRKGTPETRVRDSPGLSSD